MEVHNKRLHYSNTNRSNKKTQFNLRKMFYILVVKMAIGNTIADYTPLLLHTFDKVYGCHITLQSRWNGVNIIPLNPYDNNIGYDCKEEALEEAPFACFMMMSTGHSPRT